MKTKLTAIFVTLVAVIMFFSGCSSGGAEYAATLTKGSKVITECTENIEDMLMKATTEQGDSIFKSVAVDESKGLFYNSYSVKVVTNTLQNVEDKYVLRVTVPGTIGQTKDGVIDENEVVFEMNDFTAEHDFAAYADSNNYTAVIVIIVILLAVLGAFFYFTKRKDG